MTQLGVVQGPPTTFIYIWAARCIYDMDSPLSFSPCSWGRMGGKAYVVVCTFLCCVRWLCACVYVCVYTVYIIEPEGLGRR